MIQIDYYNQAAAYANQGNWAATAQLVELGLGSTPNDARLLGLKALVLTINQRHAEAETFFRRALNADPTNAETHNNFGYMLRMTGQIEDSYEYFSRAVALNENYLEGLRNLAYVAWLTDRYEVARNSFSRYYAFKPDDPKIPSVALQPDRQAQGVPGARPQVPRLAAAQSAGRQAGRGAAGAGPGRCPLLPALRAHSQGARRQNRLRGRGEGAADGRANRVRRRALQRANHPAVARPLAEHLRRRPALYDGRGQLHAASGEVQRHTGKGGSGPRATG